MAGIFTKLFGTHSERELKKIAPIADKVMALDEEYRKLTDAQLRAKTDEFKKRYADGETLEDLLPEAYATMREASDRVLGMRHYRVQVIGGIVLHQGRIAEMRTGEGKTLMATLPAYLNAIAGQGVHIVTVNDYLAKRDSEWMGKIYRWLGLSVGLIIHAVEAKDRKAMYACDIVYGTNNEFGFDYLRDNMAIYMANRVQRGHVFVIVDEVDSILIDEARTPLIISGQGEKSTNLYKVADSFARQLTSQRFKEIDAKEEQDDIQVDYIVDEKAKTATITPRGQARAEKYFSVDNLSDAENTTLLHHINQAIKARGIMQRDVDYVIRDGEIVIVDEFTGRLMFGRRYNDGLHQAIEAKEKVEVKHESKTLATVTFQNFFRLYKKISGMTGTALTEETEFREIYNLDVIVIPTNRPIARLDNPDAVFKNESGKMKAIVRQVKACYEKGQPILVGTVSIDKSEEISRILKREGIKHTVLNAKYHEQEAEIIAQAGKPYAVTIATNMAGRGTDIKLGGNDEQMATTIMRQEGFSEAMLVEATGFAETDNEQIMTARARYAELMEGFRDEVSRNAEIVCAAGGLYILGTERHESRRIDNQLRGRAGRQGDPGESSFYISMEDDLMRLFGSERIQNMMESLGLEEDQPIDQKILSNAIETAQSKVESRNFGVRKHVLEYDDVLNNQRAIVYGQRIRVLEGQDISASVLEMLDDTIRISTMGAIGEHKIITADMVRQATAPFRGLFLTKEDCIYTDDQLDDLTMDDLNKVLIEKGRGMYALREQAFGSNAMREVERVVLLRNVDSLWMEHIDAMTELRNGIGLRALAQRNPVIEYKREGFEMFDLMIDTIREQTVRNLFLLKVRAQEPKREMVAKETGAMGANDGTPAPSKTVRHEDKIGRNDMCSCGSGLKYKKCCGKDS